jgi:hypothetical protein
MVYYRELGFTALGDNSCDKGAGTESLKYQKYKNKNTDSNMIIIDLV